MLFNTDSNGARRFFAAVGRQVIIGQAGNVDDIVPGKLPGRAALD